MSRSISFKNSDLASKLDGFREQVMISEKQNPTNSNLLSVLKSGRNIVSIEICPGKHFKEELLSKVNPNFCSIPWLGKPNLDNPGEIPSIQLAKRLEENGYNALLHLAGRNFKKEELKVVLDEVKNCGIRNIFAVQGDWNHVQEKDDKKCDFPYASDLVLFIRENYENQFCIGVAGYPDQHPQSLSKEEDLKFLKNKIDCGADFIITQGIFDYSTLESFIKSCRNLKIDVPILPGIFIADSRKSLAMIKNICQANVPDRLMKSYEILQTNEEVLKDFVVNFVGTLIQDIFEGGICPGVHIFSLNNLEIVDKVLLDVQEINKELVST